MKLFSIKELERFTGIKAHTIRMWEKRYHLLEPLRNNGATRCYTLSDVKRLLDIAFLNNHGLKISHIAMLDEEGIKRMLGSEHIHDGSCFRQIAALIMSMFESNIEAFEDVLDICVATLGIDRTISTVIIPFLEKVNLLSYKDTSCEAHFAVSAVRKKIIVGIEKTNSVNNCQKKVLLFLPAGEHYDLTLLYMTYIIKSSGVKPLYLGANISVENLKLVSQKKMPDSLYTYLVPGKALCTEELSEYLKAQLPATKLFIATSETNKASNPNGNVNYFHYRDVKETIGQYH